MTRHAELNGADAEPLSVYDSSCDYCGKVTYSELLRQVKIGRSTSLLCSGCFERQRRAYDEMVDRQLVDLDRDEYEYVSSQGEVTP